MKRKWLALGGLVFATTLTVGIIAKQPESLRELAPDQPGEEEDLNRELWKFAKGNTPYPDIKTNQNTAIAAEISLPNGWKINPAGKQLEVGRLPYTGIIYAGKLVVLNTGWYGKDPQQVSIIDTKNGKIIKTLPYPSLFPSAEVGLDKDLYISGGFDKKIYRINSEFQPIREYPVNGYAAGIASIDSKRLAVAYLVTEDAQKAYLQGKIAILNTETGQIEKEANAGYFPYGVRVVNDKIYVSLVGENKVLVYDNQLQLIKNIAAGNKPQEFCRDGDKLYTINTTSDNISVIDTKKDAVIDTIDVRHKNFKFGSSPTSCTINGNNLYVTQAEINAVAVFDKNKKQLQGFVPTGWYPTKVILNDGQMLALSAKGIRPRRPNPQGPQPISGLGGKQYVLSLLKGSLSIVPEKDIKSNLAKWSKQIEEGSPIYSAKEGMKLPIRHVFYIIKENRTYDQVLGDLGRGNGDKSLTLFGRKITPNHHKISEDFVTLDNFYANGEVSVLGHSFTTSGYASPFLEWLGNMRYSERYKSYPFGIVPATFSPAYLWNALEAKNIDYRIYGEPYYIFTRCYQLIVETYGEDSELAKKFYEQSMKFAASTDRGKTASKLFKNNYGKADNEESAAKLLENAEFTNAISNIFVGDDSLALAIQKNADFRQKFAKFLYHYPLNYHYYDLSYSDLQRFADWKTDFDKQLKAGKVAQLHYIWLPNDHTAGENPNFPDPYQLVAQNDAALAKIVETISNSPIWKNSLILVVEDDAQAGPDHVDATRTIALAISPYVKRGVVVSDRYDQLSLLRTIGVVLGFDPIGLNDALAVPMFGIFSEKPNNSPYIPATPSSYLMNSDQKLYQEIK